MRWSAFDIAVAVFIVLAMYAGLTLPDRAERHHRHWDYAGRL